jgi:hypothetical protein
MSVFDGLSREWRSITGSSKSSLFIISSISVPSSIIDGITAVIGRTFFPRRFVVKVRFGAVDGSDVAI